MKCFIFLLVAFGICTVTTAQVTPIPDPNFEAYLIAQGFDTDSVVNGQILTLDAENVDSMNIGAAVITSFDGLQAFSNLEYLSISGYNGNSIDLMGLSSLEVLRVEYSPIDSIYFYPSMVLRAAVFFVTNLKYLDLSNCLQLTRLSAKRSLIDSVNLNLNTKLTSLGLEWNSLDYINLANNPRLKYLSLSSNNFENINITPLDSLLRLGVIANQLTKLDVSNNPQLEWLFCDSNQIENLDLRFNPRLEFVNFNANQLTELNMQNGNNGLIPNFGFTALGNPNLSCIQVDSVGYSQANWTSVDPQATFSTYCGYDLSVLENKPSSLNIYPNPSTNQFIVQLPSIIKNGVIQIFNARGQVVIQQNILNENKINIATNLPAGYYIVRVNTEAKNFTDRIVIR